VLNALFLLLNNGTEMFVRLSLRHFRIRETRCNKGLLLLLLLLLLLHSHGPTSRQLVMFQLIILTCLYMMH